MQKADIPQRKKSEALFKMKVLSPRIGAKVLLKVENMTDGSISYEKQMLTTVANAWEEISFDYSLIDVSKSYQKIVLIFDNGTMGDGSANFTFLFDDIVLTSSGTVVQNPTLPLDFESSTITYTFTNFDGGVASVLNNPQSSGINTSAKVAKMVKGAGQPWGGSWIALAAPDTPRDGSARRRGGRRRRRRGRRRRGGRDDRHGDGHP